jgi:hypothetical protein
MDHTFGMFRGSLATHAVCRIDSIARRHDARLVTHVDAQCSCGHGCKPHSCRKSERGWFTTRNLGEPFNGATANAVLADVKAAGFDLDLEADRRQPLVCDWSLGVDYDEVNHHG